MYVGIPSDLWHVEVIFHATTSRQIFGTVVSLLHGRECDTAYHLIGVVYLQGSIKRVSRPSPDTSMDGKLIENESTSGSTFNGNSTGKQKRALEQVATGAGTCDAFVSVIPYTRYNTCRRALILLASN